jgi:hypothetical protein
LGDITVRNHFRRGAWFIADARHHCRPLDRNERARIMFQAEALERRTKPVGGRNGVLGYVGLAVLKTLVCGFLRRSDGMCCPSYVELMAATGLCKQSVANGLKRLEASGILKIIRRLIREVIDGVMVTRQASNLYAIHEPAKSAGQLPVREPVVRPFPRPGIGAFMRKLGLPWKHSGVTFDNAHHSGMRGSILADGVHQLTAGSVPL